MKLTRILTIGAMAAAAYAQSSGGITIGGSIPGAISITNDSNGQLTATQTLQSLLPSNSSTLATLDSAVNVRLRSNQQFHLNATATFSNTGAGIADGGTSITAGDIGFGITTKDVSRANVVTGRALDAINGKFDYTTVAMSALPVTNGKTPFDGATHGTINELLIGTPSIMTGNRISMLGNIQSNDNYMLLTFNAGALPQYFTPTTGFSAVITLTPVIF